LGYHYQTCIKKREHYYNQKMKLWGITNSKTLEYHFFRYLEVLFLLIPKLGNTKMVIEHVPYISDILIWNLS